MPRRLRDEYRETYQEVYHYAISDDEIDRAIYLDENHHSAGCKSDSCEKVLFDNANGGWAGDARVFENGRRS